MKNEVHTLILADTRIEWYAWGEGSDGVKVLDDVSRDRVNHLITQGFREGELNIATNDTDMIRGYWRLAATEVDASLTTFKNLRIRPDGEANYYGLIDGDKWVAVVHLNGEFMLARQEAIMQRIIDALKAE